MFSMLVCVIQQPLSRTPCCNVERTARRERWGNSYAAHDFYGPRPPQAIFVKLESREYRADYHKGKEQTQDVEKSAFEHLSSTSGNEFLYYYSAILMNSNCHIAKLENQPNVWPFVSCLMQANLKCRLLKMSFFSQGRRVRAGLEVRQLNKPLKLKKIQRSRAENPTTRLDKFYSSTAVNSKLKCQK